MIKNFYFLLVIILAGAVASLSSCIDDEVSTSSADLLTFSTDTVKFDTVITNQGSPTKQFLVYNRGKKVLNISSIKVAGESKGHFFLNVDGMKGDEFHDIEVRGEDSIFVFVESRLNPTNQDAPEYLEDNIEFVTNGVMQRVALTAWGQDVVILNDSTLTKPTHLTRNKPYLIYGVLTVDSLIEVTIDPGATLLFHDKASLLVKGKLTANGTEDRPIIMRGDRLDDMFDYLPYDRVSGQWNGIRIHENSKDNLLIRTEIRNPLYGVVCDSAALDMDHCRIEMDECVIHNCEGAGLEAVNAYVRLDHCQLTNTGGDCLSLFGGFAEINDCTLAQFYPFAADRGAAIRFANYYGGTDLPLYVYCSKSILTGYADDVVMGDMHGEDASTFGYEFRQCLMRTPEVTDDPEHFADIIWETPKDSIEGKKHFVTIDEDNLIYDFHLDSLSTAKGLGCY